MSRCPMFLVAALSLIAFAVPLAAAQTVVPAFTVTTTAIVAEVYPGEVAVYNVTVGNPDILLDRDASMSGLVPAGWTSDFSVDPLGVPHSGSNTTTWRIFVPATTTPGTYPAQVEAKDNWSFTRANVSVVVKQPPVTPGPAPPSPPDITLAASVGDAAESGEVAQGTLTITSRDARALDLTISIAQNNGWSSSIPAADTTRRLFEGATTTVRLQTLVPQLDEDATNEFVVTVRASASDGAIKVFTARWTVLGIATEPSVFDPTQPTTSGTNSGTGTTSSSGARTSRVGQNLDVFVDPLEVQVPSDGQTTALVVLVNTGTEPLSIVLTGEPPATWRPFGFEPAEAISLAPGERGEVTMTIAAPALPPGGTTQARVYAIDDGLVRSASFVIHTVVGAPVDKTETSTTNAPAAPEGGLPSAGVNTLVLVGVAAVGGAAAVVASRPLREKLVWVGVGLYTRLARPDVLGHEDREKLYRLVETQPGIHFHALQRDLAWNTGTLTYHLRVLERHGFVVSRRDGLYRRFYLSGAAPRKEVFENQGPTGLRADVIEAIKNRPGISQTDLALGLGANKQTVNYHVKALERTGSIRLEKRGRDTFLFPGTGVPPATVGAADDDEADDAPARV